MDVMNRLSLFACAALLGCGAPRPRGPEAARPHLLIEHLEPTVLVVALGIDGMHDVRDVQLQIVSKAARHGAVLVLATSSEQRTTLNETCTRYDDLCERLLDGTVRVVVEPHLSPWIRDYGPFVDIEASGQLAVIDARYDDTRRRLALEYRREWILDQRRRLLEARAQGNSEDSFLDKVQHETQLRDLEALGKVLQEEGDLRQRAMDDDAPFYIAQAGFGSEHFQLVRTPISLDGGNLFVLQDATCLTTTDTVAKNGGDRGLVERELGSRYHCRRVTFLEPLPGDGIIKHVDMFLMPVRDKTVLLASYEPSSTRFRDRFDQLDKERQALVVDAAIAMRRNKQRLQALGYVVNDVPALFPQRAVNTIYFPTLLNGIVQVSRDRRQHLLLPDYDTDNDNDVIVKYHARQAIQTAFGPGVDIQTIEATAAAARQGTLHCLSNTIPYADSVFEKDDGITADIRRELGTGRRNKPRREPPPRQAQRRADHSP